MLDRLCARKKVQKIINKNVYRQLGRSVDVIEYEVKFLGQSYLNTEWMRSQDLDQGLINEYQAREQTTKTQIKQKSKQPFPKNNDVRFYFKQNSTKNKRSRLKSKQTSQLVRQYCWKGPQSHSIVINTPIKKQQNHFIFGDRVESILHEVHQLYQLPEQQLKAHSAKSTESCILVKQLCLPLGNPENLKNKSLLEEKIFPLMFELLKTQKMKGDRHFMVKLIETRWKDGSVSRVKGHYLSEYEPELLSSYRAVRQNVVKLWIKSSKLYYTSPVAKQEYKTQQTQFSQNISDAQIE